MTNTYDEYADKAAASYRQGRMDEQGAWVEAVKGQRDRYRLAARSADRRWMKRGGTARWIAQDVARGYAVQAAALDALLRRMGVE